MSLQNKKILVTGGTGFIGSHLVKRLLKENSIVSVIDKNLNLKNIEEIKDKVSTFESDLGNKESLNKIIKEISPDTIFHLASWADPNRNIDPTEIFKNNFNSTINLIESLNGNFDQFVNTGTCEEYGNGSTPFLENQAPIAVSPYSATKIATTHYVQMLSISKELPTVTLRPFLTYGEMQQNHKMLIPYSILSFLNNNPLKLTKGEQTRDFIYVSDVVEAYILAAKKGITNEIINIGSGKEYKIKDIILKIKELTNSTLKVNFGELPYRKGETMHFYCSNEKAKKLLSWEPQISIEEGLKKTINWFKDNQNKN